jgi:hypothetical protein
MGFSCILVAFFVAALIVERTKISVPHLAREWGVSSKKITDFIKSGELKAIDVSTSREQRPRYLIDRKDIERFEAGRVVIPEAETSKPMLRKRAVGQVKDFF